MAGLTPSAVVVVATCRALKSHGGVPKAELNKENIEALKAGLPNLMQHVGNIKNVWRLPVVVALNRFQSPAFTDTDAEIQAVEDACKAEGVNVVLSEVWAKGGEGGEALAREVVRLCEDESQQGKFTFAYDDSLSLKEKVEAIATKVYHADGVDFLPAASSALKDLENLGYGKCPVCMAKTQYSFTDNEKKLGAPRGWRITVREVSMSAGAGFVVCLTGAIMKMPGLPAVPAAEKIDVDNTGKISGLF
jgi:formate--tetrahydrofolate ligase